MQWGKMFVTCFAGGIPNRVSARTIGQGRHLEIRFVLQNQSKRRAEDLMRGQCNYLLSEVRKIEQENGEVTGILLWAREKLGDFDRSWLPLNVRLAAQRGRVVLWGLRVVCVLYLERKERRSDRRGGGGRDLANAEKRERMAS